MYNAFGDDSSGIQHIVFGFAILKEAKIPVAEALLDQIKGHDAVGSRLHCRELFEPAARLKTPWKHLSMHEVFDLYQKLIDGMNDIGWRPIIASARKADFPKKIPALDLRHVDPEVTELMHTKGFELREKQIALFCAQGLFVPIAKSMGLDCVKICVDPDRTKIQWLSGNRQPVNEVKNIFIDLGPGRELVKPNIMAIGEQKPKLLELADALAYISQRAITGGNTPNAQRFKALFSGIEPEHIKFAITPNGGLGFSIPNEMEKPFETSKI